MNPNATMFFPKGLNPFAEEYDPFEYSDPEDTEVTFNAPGLTMGVSKTIYQTGTKIGHITYNGLIFQIFFDKDNHVAILLIPDKKYDMFFPLNMSIRDAIHYYFGEKNIVAEDESYMLPMSHASFCVITVE